jgi:DNA/RNA endonuclease YhcR with UshA esterase domain
MKQSGCFSAALRLCERVLLEPSRCPMRHGASAILVLVSCAGLWADDAKPLSTEAAAKKIGEKVTLEMDVKSTGQSRTGIVFLNSMPNRNDGKNFVIVIRKDIVDKFKKAGVADPREYYRNKTIRVTGTVTEYMNRPEIEVTDPGQIKIVEKK